jgi:nicotinic acid mononucleotide adenylyltransferase
MLRLALSYLLLMKASDDIAAVASRTSSAGLETARAVSAPTVQERVAWNVTYGGSFNPFHVGHEQIARHLCDVRGVRRVVVIPAGRSPGRQPAADGVDALMPWEMRYEMAQASLRPVVAAAAAAAECELIVSDIERPAPGGRPNFTWETLQRLMASSDELALPAARAGSERWAMVLGADQALHFHKWKDASAILSAGVAIWVVPRSGKTASVDPRRDAETVWAQIVSAVSQSEIGRSEQDAAPLLVWQGTTARGFLTTMHADDDWETMRWLGWDDVGKNTALGAGSDSCEEAPALSSSAIRRGKLGIQAVAPAAREIWTRWYELHAVGADSREGAGVGREPEPEPGL